MKLDIKQLLLKFLQTPIIIESGTDGIWTYRKWSDGTAECWGKTDAKTYSFTAQSGTGYYTSEQQNLPTGLFTSVIVGFADRLQGTGSTPSNSLMTINVSNLTTAVISYYVQSTYSGSQSLAISLYVIGKWK
jgi:hypothetical protein